MYNSHTISSTALIGIIFMLCNTAALAVSDIASKILRNELSSGFIVFIYKFGLLLITLPWILRHGTQHIKTKRLHFHILRSFFGTFGSIAFIQGLKNISMVDAAAFENLQYVIVVLLSVVFFNDKLNATKIAAVILGFVGAYIIVNPSIISDLVNNSYNTDTGIKDYSKYAYTILAISCWSINTVLVKSLGNTEHNKTQMFYLLVFASLWSFPAAFIKWDIVSMVGQDLPLMPHLYDPGIGKLHLEHLLLLTIMGSCYFIHGVCYFKALKHDLSIVTPFRYTKLVFSGILGYALFGEEIDRYSLVGYCIVMLSSFMLIRYEIYKRRKKIPAHQ